MNEENLNTANPIDEESLSAKESKKRISYVSKDLKSMIEFVAKIYNQLGHTIYHSNKAIATVHGLSPDSIKQHLTSAQQYNLFELKHGIGYKITDQFQKVYLWKSEDQRRSAVIGCLKHPETYQQLFKDYEYHVVPIEGVKNHFIRSFGFKEDIAAKAAQVFLENLREYELLDGRGVLTSALPSKPIIPEIKIDNQEDQNTENKNGNSVGENDPNTGNNLPVIQQRVDKFIFQTELDRTGKKTVPIYLVGEKQAWLVYPDDITEDEIELVKHQIEGVLLRIKLEAKIKAKESKQEN